MKENLLISWFFTVDQGESSDFFVRYHGSRRIYSFHGSLPWIKENLFISWFVTMDQGESTHFVAHDHG